jgi:AraC-like DNA-binding protein
MVQYLSESPGRPIGDFVERFWQISDSPSHRQERIVPSGTFELVVNLREDEFRIYDAERPAVPQRYSGAIVSGAYQRAFVIDAKQHETVVGIHFKPGGAFPFLGTGSDELADRHVDLESLWGTAAAELRARLCDAQGPAERFQLLEKALIARLARHRESHYAVRFGLRVLTGSDANLKIREIAKRAGLSQRRFIQVFEKEVGLTPKLFYRLSRFQRALASLRRTPAPDWAGLAFECGYFDQSHFINDFRGFSGLRPSEFLAQRGPRVMENHVPVLAR